MNNFDERLNLRKKTESIDSKVSIAIMQGINNVSGNTTKEETRSIGMSINFYHLLNNFDEDMNIIRQYKSIILGKRAKSFEEHDKRVLDSIEKELQAVKLAENEKERFDVLKAGVEEVFESYDGVINLMERCRLKRRAHNINKELDK